MIQLTQLSYVHNILRYSLTRHLQTYNQFQVHTRQFIKTAKQLSKSKTCNFNLLKCTKVCLVFATAPLIHINVNQKVNCDAQTSRLVGFQKRSSKNEKFDWYMLWYYLKPHIWYFILAIAGALAVAFLNIQIPQVMGGLVNVISKFSDMKDSDLFMKEVKEPVGKLVSMYLAQSAFTFFYIYMLSYIGESMAFNMKSDLFGAIIKQDIAFFDQHRTGEIINRLTTDVQEFKSSFKQTVSGGLRSGAQIVGCSISLLMISPHMTLVTLLCIPTIIGIGTAFGTFLRKISRNAQDQVEKTTAVADEAISNVRTVRAFASEDSEKELFDSEAACAMSLNQKLGFGIGVFQAGTNMFLNGMVLGIMCMGGYLLSTNQLSAGQLMAYLMATQTIQRSLAQMSLLFGSVVRGMSAGARVFEYIKLEPSVALRGGKTLPLSSVAGTIEFKDVTFVYPSRPEKKVLSNFNLQIPAGKTVAIVGTSGNGKSTIAALIERFYDVNQGSVTLDGHDIKTLDPSWLRKYVLGFISQEPVLFATSILENIRYGKQNATDEEVRKAAQLANAHDFITSFPDGYNTLAGERGVTLSGGQKQRIAIARALLKNPAVLILDEATSALDAESEKTVQVAIDMARKGRTVIIIAHRLSTVQNADFIVVLNKGKIVEMGTHESLQRQKGLYWSLVFEQQQQPPAA